MLPWHQCQTYVSALLTALKQPLMTATQAKLKRDGTTSMMPSTTLPWTPLARERGRTQIGMKKGFWTRFSDYNLESSAGWVQEEPLREVSCCTQESQEQSPADCSMLHQWILDSQLSADCGNIHVMYDGMKKAFGPSTTKITPLMSTTNDIITDWGKQMERWAKYHQEIYLRENTVTDSTVESTYTLPILEELDVPPSVEELSKAIDSLACGKAPGKDGILPEVIKSGKQTALLHHLHELLLWCREEGTVPPDMCNANTITLYKNKSDCSDCNNYCGISILSIVGKTFAHMVLNRLQVLAEDIYPEAQCGFRAGRSTINMIFSLHQLQETCHKQRWPLYIAFIDLSKAFDLVSRKGLCTLLQRIRCPPKLLRMITSFHEGMQGIVQYDDSSLGSFPIRNGVKQGCILAPTLLSIFFSLLLSYAFSQSEDSIYLCTRSDRSLFSLTCLQVKTKVWRVLIRELLFADAAALTAHTEEALQGLISFLTGACREFGLTISLKKTKIMG